MSSKLPQVPEPVRPFFQWNSSLSRAVHNPASSNLRSLVDQFGYPFGDEKKSLKKSPRVNNLEECWAFIGALRGWVYDASFASIWPVFKDVLDVLFPSVSQLVISQGTWISESLLSAIIAGDRKLTSETFNKLKVFLEKQGQV
jgi:hypothetical protein